MYCSKIFIYKNKNNLGYPFMDIIKINNVGTSGKRNLFTKKQRKYRGYVFRHFPKTNIKNINIE